MSTTIRTSATVDALNNEGYASASLFDKTLDASIASLKYEKYVIAVSASAAVTKTNSFNVSGMAWKSDVGVQVNYTGTGLSVSWGGRMTGSPTGKPQYAKEAVIVLDTPLLLSEFTALNVYGSGTGTVELTVWGY